VVALVVAVVVGAADAWTYVPPFPATKAAVERVIVEYELVPAPVWPAGRKIGDRFSTQERAALQAAYVTRLAACSTGDSLAKSRTMDYARAVLTYPRKSDGVVVVASRGRVVYYDFLSRRLNGDLVVRAAVEHVFTEEHWDRGRRKLTGRSVTAVPKAVIMQFTMHKADGVWKVAENVGWRFLDIPSGRITAEP
jgi:hypothetical protein